MARQLSFLGSKRLEHGGEVRKGRRKLERPIDPDRPLHVVMRSTRARGKWSFLHRKSESRVQSLVYCTARKHGVSVFGFANVGNHLHVLVKAPSREMKAAGVRPIPVSWLPGLPGLPEPPGG